MSSVSPAADALMESRLNRALIAVLRVGVALLWIQNVSWKDPPTFGEGASPSGLYQFTNFAVEYPVFPPYSWLVEHLVLPNFAFFGWAVLLVEAALGAFLLIGLATRLLGPGRHRADGRDHAVGAQRPARVGVVVPVDAAGSRGAVRDRGRPLRRPGRRAPSRLAVVRVEGGAAAGESVMTGRATLALGVASVASVLFSFVRGPFQFLWLPPVGVAIAVGLGLLACAAGWLGSRTLTLAAGAAFLLAAVVLMVLLLRGGFLIGNASGFSLWLGLGVGLIVVALNAPSRATTRLTERT